MKIGVSLRLGDLDRFASIKERTGYQPDHIQLKGLPADLSPIRASMKETLNRFRAEFPSANVSLHAFKFNFCEKVEPVLAVWLSLARQTLAVAAEIGAEFASFHAGYGMGGTRIRHAAYRDALVPVIRSLVEFAEPLGVAMHIENLYPRPRGSEMSMLGDRLSDFDCFFRQISSPSFRLCYDYGHGNIDEHGIDILRRHAGLLGSVHAHDNDQQSDIHWPVLHKAGTIDWQREFDFLESIGFGGQFILESDFEDQIISLLHMKDAGILGGY